MTDYSPVYRNGSNPFTMTAAATLVGGQIVDSSGSGTVTASVAGSVAVVGVAAHDCAAGARITVWPTPGVVHETTAPAAITAGAGIQTAAAGNVATVVQGTGAGLGTLWGTALTTAGAGAKCRWIGR